MAGEFSFRPLEVLPRLLESLEIVGADPGEFAGRAGGNDRVDALRVQPFDLPRR